MIHRGRRRAGLAGAWLAMLACAGCGFKIAGPAYPEEDGRAYLRRRGYSVALADAVVAGEPLARSVVADLGSSPSIDVRFLVARNPHLAGAEIDRFIRDSDDFVRSGAACNPSLSSNQVEVLASDPSHTVYAKLAGNPSLSEESLLRLRTERNLGILWFAMNPNCPESIRKEIRVSGDALAQRWVEIIDGWKKEGVFVQGPDGRWRRPVTR